MNIISTSSSDEAAFEAAKQINEIFSAEEQNILFLTSGGSAFKILDLIDTDNLNDRITISVLDERYSKDPKINNFLQLTNTDFYKTVLKKNCRIIQLSIGDKSIEKITQDFERGIKDWVTTYPQGKIIATLGVGEDGHTSGIMPYPEDIIFFKKMFENDSKWVVHYNAYDKNPYSLRLTTTLPFLRKIDYAIVYIVGEEKRKALNKILDEEGSLAETPARIVRELIDVHVITDINEAH